VEPEAHSIELDKLVGLFFPVCADLGAFHLVSSGEIPEPQQSLLNHDRHMTVTVEKFHSSPVDVSVLQERRVEKLYSREICLKKQSDQQIVQYGIVQLNFNHLADEVQSEITGQGKPLGRILIEHNVLRRVKLLSLYRIQPSDYLACKLGGASGDVFGRTAVIYCNDEPAIELLEIVRV
jgi:chorismate-pyruvate lyase